MPDPVESPAKSKARELALELRALQAKLNHTIEQLCALTSGSAMAEVLGAEGAAAQRSFSPAWLQFPVAEAVVTNPLSGQPLGEGAVFYTDAEGPMLQLLQQPLLRHPESAFCLQVNYAQFQGEWLSVVFDARALLADQPAGKVSLSLAAELAGTPLHNAQIRCVWSGLHQEGEQRFTLRQNQLNQAQAELEYLDPSLLQRFDLHLVFTLPERGVVELRRLNLGLTVVPAGGDEPVVSTSVFESLS